MPCRILVQKNKLSHIEMLKQKHYIVVVAIICSSIPISNASVYKWIDNAGQVNYSDFPPNSASGRVMVPFIPNRDPEKTGLRESEKTILKKIEQEYQMAIRKKEQKRRKAENERIASAARLETESSRCDYYREQTHFAENKLKQRCRAIICERWERLARYFEQKSREACS